MSVVNGFRHLPFPLEVLQWNDLPAEKRQFFCDEDAIAQRDKERIVGLSSQSARELANWLLLRIPHAEDRLSYPHKSLLKLTRNSWNTAAGVAAVRDWLDKRAIAHARSVWLIYDRSCILAMPWKLLLRYWDSLAWSVGYSMIATDAQASWACLFHHEQYIQFGSHMPTINK